MTVGDALNFGVEFLQKSGIDEAKVDAWLLFEFVTGIQRTEYFLCPGKELKEAEFIEYRRLLEKRGSHYPLQYITNAGHFMGYDFYVDESVLVPRNETELLVLEAEKFISEFEKVRVLDMCTGSGCIAISLKLRNEKCSVQGVDISEKALAVAEKNAKHFGLDISFCKSDLFSDIPCEKYNIIVSNPPYIETDKIASLMEEVKDYEPVSALDGGKDGLYFYRKIIEGCSGFLAPFGKILFEIGYNQADCVKSLLLKEGFKDIKVIKDMSGLDRIVIGGI